MKMNSAWIYEKNSFFIFAAAYEWKSISNFDAIMFCLLKVRHALHPLHSWMLHPWPCHTFLQHFTLVLQNLDNCHLGICVLRITYNAIKFSLSYHIVAH